jgi:hypothetical protein
VSRIALLMLLFACATLPRSATAAADRHLGVGSCANSVCHGTVVANPSPALPLNEYVVWSTRDRHAKAYETLLGEQAKAMAQRMGLPDAANAKVCLDCHADNVPVAQRGPTFQLGDGVGCEACHGGASRWIESHAQPGRPHAANLAAGMFDLVDPRNRVERCLDCHQGNDSQRATHEMMAAGHPRLSFEVDTFMVLQPYHHRPDAAYAKRKAVTPPVSNWLVGQAASAVRLLDLLVADSARDTPFPELVAFDCQACHHQMDDRRTRARAELAMLAPGRVRIDDSSLVMTRALFAALEPAAGTALHDGIVALHVASQADRKRLRSAAQSLGDRIEQLAEPLAARKLAPAEVVALERALRDLTLGGGVTDYALAEQVVLGLALLCNDAANTPCAQRQAALDALYAATADQNRFAAAKFRDAMKLWR